MRILPSSLPAILLLSAALLLSACDSAEERAEQHYQDALVLIEKGDTDRAIVELRNVFQLNGSHREARQTMAELMLGRGDRRAAYSQYLRLAEQYPDELDARINLAEIAFEMGDWDELDRHGAKAEELAPEDPRVQAIALARAYRDAVLAEDPATLRVTAQEVEVLLEALPESVLLHVVLIDNAERNGDHARALAEIDWLIEREPSNPRYYQDRLKVLARLGDEAAMEQQLREMVAAFPDDPASKEQLIRFYLARNDLDAAEQFMRELAAASAPDDPVPTLDLIRFLAATGRTEAAQEEIAKAIAERNDPVRFRVLGAGLDFELGERERAIATMEEVLAGAEPSKETRDIRVALAKMLLAMGNEVGARSEIEKVLSEDPTAPEALKMQAGWLIAADDTDEAIAALRSALDQAPDDAQAMTLMAEAYSRSGSPQLSNQYLALAVEASGNAPAETIRYARVLIGDESYLPAEDILIQALRLAPGNSELLVALGQLYLQMEDFGRAQNVADTLRRLETEEAQQAANRIEAERINRQSGTDEAMAYLEQLAGGADASLASKIALVRARMGTGDTAGALQLAQELEQADPENEALDFMLATTHAVNGQLDQAEAIYRRMLETDPARPLVWLELVRLEQRQGDRDAAKATLVEGLAQIPEDSRLLWTQASFLEQDGDIDGAIAIYEDLYERNSSSVIVANNLASLLASYRDDAASLERAWTIARRLQGTEIPAMQDTYGWIAHRRGQSEEALPYLEAAAAGVPDDPLAQYHLGKAYMALNRPQDALAMFRRTVDLAGPSDQRAVIEDARALLRSLQAEPPPAEN